MANPDFLRADSDAVGFVREFVSTGKPVAAVCHGPWTLVEAGVVDGRTLTSWPSLCTDLSNAGASRVDEKVFVDGNLPGAPAYRPQPVRPSRPSHTSSEMEKPRSMTWAFSWRPAPHRGGRKTKCVQERTRSILLG